MPKYGARFIVRLSTLAMVVVLASAGPETVRDAQAQDAGKAFPSDSGMVNVKTGYGAKGDGATDDTMAIRQAIQENVGTRRTLYFPDGTYLVSDRLEAKGSDGQWHSGLRLQGQSREKTVLRLQDSAAGYGNSAVPKAVIYSASDLFVEDPYGGGKDYPGLGEGNEAFDNYIEDLTVDTGAANRGAIGLDYLANNQGAVRNVTIRGQGVAGLAMLRKWPGPCLIKDVRIEGFDYGVTVANPEFGVTFEGLSLSGQAVAGIRNRDNVLSIRGLRSTNSVPVIRNETAQGMVTLVDGTFEGGSSAVDAVENKGALYAKNVAAAGYRSAIKGVPGSSVVEYASNRVPSLFAGGERPPSLPVKAAPTYDEDPAGWASVVDYGAVADDWEDDTEAIQAALDSGKSTVYFPAGRYFVRDTLRVRGNVRKVAGMNSALAPSRDAFGDANDPKPIFKIEEGNRDAVVIERLTIAKLHQTSPSFGVIGFEQATPEALVLKDISFYGGEYKHSYRGTAGAGPLFVENVHGTRWQFVSNQSIWARQLNPEADASMGDDPLVRNGGAKLWVLGIKTEGTSTVAETSEGGQTEVLGGLLYPVGSVAPEVAAFVVTDEESGQALSYAVSAYGAPERNYRVHAREIRGGETRTLERGAVPQRGLGSLVPLHTTSYGEPTGSAGSSSPTPTGGVGLSSPSNAAPTITKLSSSRKVSATVADAETDLARDNVKLYVDGKQKTTFSYDQATDRLSYKSKTRKPGRHKLKIVATDGDGLSTNGTWSFKIRRR